VHSEFIGVKIRSDLFWEIYSDLIWLFDSNLIWNQMTYNLFKTDLRTEKNQHINWSFPTQPWYDLTRKTNLVWSNFLKNVKLIWPDPSELKSNMNSLIATSNSDEDWFLQFSCVGKSSERTVKPMKRLLVRNGVSFHCILSWLGGTVMQPLRPTIPSTAPPKLSSRSIVATHHLSPQKRN
jgi:hypothetical protein